jgi:hypothetical protein
MYDCVEQTNIATTVKQAASNFRPHQNDDSTQQEIQHMSTTTRASMKSNARARGSRAWRSYPTWVYAACMCSVAIVSVSLWHAASAIQVVA